MGFKVTEDNNDDFDAPISTTNIQLREQQKEQAENRKAAKEAKRLELIKRQTHGLPALPRRERNIREQEQYPVKRKLRYRDRYFCNYCMNEVRAYENVDKKTAIQNHIERNQCHSKILIKNRDGKVENVDRVGSSVMSLNVIESRYNNYLNEPYPNEEVNYYTKDGESVWDHNTFIDDSLAAVEENEEKNVTLNDKFGRKFTELRRSMTSNDTQPFPLDI
jgi:DNA-directed RNA polymerase subunit RPC12/RpoP